MAKKGVPRTLRILFIIHFVIDFLIAIPLFFAPVWTLHLFGFSAVEPLTARLVAAALFAIGGSSLLMHNGGKEAFKTMLNLKLVWSVAAMAGILLALFIDGAPLAGWVFFGLFFVFFLIWAYYRQRF